MNVNVIKSLCQCSLGYTVCRDDTSLFGAWGNLASNIKDRVGACDGLANRRVSYLSQIGQGFANPPMSEKPRAL